MAIRDQHGALPRWRSSGRPGETGLTAPNGTRSLLVDGEPELVLPALEPSFVVSRLTAATWTSGRAGMR